MSTCGDSLNLAETQARTHFNQWAGGLAHPETLDNIDPDKLEAYCRYYAEEADRFMAMLSGNEVLALACGTASDAKYFSGKDYHYTGIDISEGMLHEARLRVPRLPLAQMTMRKLAFLPGSFDGVWQFDSLRYIPEDSLAAVLGEVHRVLKPGGLYYASWLSTQLPDSHRDPADVSQWQPLEIVTALAAANFNITSSSTKPDNPDQVAVIARAI